MNESKADRQGRKSNLKVRIVYAILGILIFVGVLFRIAGLGWGIPDALPLIPLGALAAAYFLAALPLQSFWRMLLGVFLCLWPLAMSWTQVRILLEDHTANKAARWIETNIPQGSRIGQVWSEIPSLNTRKYDLRTLRGLFPQDPSEQKDLDRQFLVLDNLPIQPFSREFSERLERDYVLLAEFRSDPNIGPWILNEPDAPHDWKCTHPVIRIFGNKTSARLLKSRAPGF